MGKNLILILILVFLIVNNVSDAATEEHPNAPGSPLGSPILPGKQSGPVVDEGKDKEQKNQPIPPSTHEEDSSKDNQVTKDMNMMPVTPPTGAKEQNNTHKDNVKEKEKDSGEQKEKEKEKDSEKAEEEEEQKEKEKEKDSEKAEEEEEQKEKEKEKENEKAEEEKNHKEKEKEKERAQKADEQKEKEKENEKAKKESEEKEKGAVGGDQSCDGMERRCRDLKSMVACIKSFDHDSKALILLIQNKGDSSLKVDISALSSGNKQKKIDIPKLQSKQVNVVLVDGGTNEITLDAGNGHCVLHLGAPVSQGNFLRWIPPYSKFMTPIYGAYLILLITFVAGGTWACCWFSKKKGPRDIPYQELEMSMPESAVAVETAEGWDEVWDDDWDEEKAVRSPGGHKISANGLTSRNSKKDDWEDWAD